jgi:hypothetical protein
MLTMFRPCIESDPTTGSPLIEPHEFFGQVWVGNPPVVGQLISLGGAERWEIVKLERFTNGLEAANLSSHREAIVAYFKLIGHPTLPEAQWDCYQVEAEHKLGGHHLAIYLDPDGKPMNTSIYFGGELPEVGEMVSVNVEPVEGQSTLMQDVAPYYQIEVIETYLPERSFYQALHICRCRIVDEPVTA